MYYLYGDAMKKIIKKYWIYGSVGCVILLALFIPREETPTVDVIANPSVEQVVVEDELTYIYVDIKGYVQNPGVYKLDYGSRLFQVINLAGGMQEEADSMAINLSMLLEDEMSVYIPSVEENFDIIVTPIDEEEDDGLIDINKASITLLETLPGIGPSTAQNIIDYRDEFGYFNVIEDILNVPNIGEVTFDEIKDLITVER